jgi:hypothetical protein
MTAPNVPNERFAPDNQTVLNQLGLLAELVGTWEGKGFNLIARPDFVDQENLYLQINQTRESMHVEPIGSPIPNRGFGQADITLFGLHYLQKVSNLANGSAMHFEPGLWITQQPTDYPPQVPPPGSQTVARMGSIPHGTSILAEGNAATFQGTPIIAAGATPIAFSAFPSFNSTPVGIPALPALPAINAAGSSEALTAAVIGKVPFSQYNVSVAPGPANPRTPFGTIPPEPNPPDPLDSVALQTVVNDPISILQNVVRQQVANGHTFAGVVINVATQTTIDFHTAVNDPLGPSNGVSVGDGQIGNIPFLLGGDPVGAKGPNAQTATVYATFWIEQVSHNNIPTFKQLQYAQMVVLNFGILSALPIDVQLAWPHVSVGTLRKVFA